MVALKKAVLIALKKAVFVDGKSQRETLEKEY